MALAVLCFRGLQRQFWQLSALVVHASDGGPPLMRLSESDDRVLPHRLALRSGRGLWRYDFRLPLGARERTAEYQIAGRHWRVRLPAARGPLRIAFTACNGFEEEPTGSQACWRNRLWRNLAAEHARAPFHVLLHGGDQLYADSMWREVPALAAWQRLSARRRLGAPFTPKMAAAVETYFFSRYCWLWAARA